ncbi:MAG: hypothetical protein PHH08_03255 [Candidatus ainarchaeum sp.]|nr:hypothetical protein [Candidatus ainarchaeum sp.]
MIWLNLDVFSVSRAIEDNFEKPNIIVSLALVLVVAAIAAISFLMNGIAVNWAAFAIDNIIKKYILFFVLAAMVFAAGMIFNSKNSRGMLMGIISSLGLVYLLTVVLAVVSLFSRLIFSQEFFSAMQNAATAGTTQELAATAALMIATMPKGANFGLFIAFLAIGAAIMVWQWIVLYKIISHSSGQKPWINLACWAVIILLFGFASAL